VEVFFKERDSQQIIYNILAYFALFTVLYNTIFHKVKSKFLQQTQLPATVENFKPSPPPPRKKGKTTQN
jgi:hypothetical protein